MILLEEHAVSHIVGGHYVEVFTHVYTSLADILTQKSNTVFEATRFYQELGHRLGEFVYTTFHPESSMPINVNQT